MYNTRAITPDDLPTIKKWYEQRGWPSHHTCLFPDDGVMIEEEGKPIYCGWLYLSSNSPVCWADWFLGDPKASSIRGLKLLIKELEELAKKKGFMYIHSAMSANIKIEPLFSSLGYGNTDEVYNHFLKRL